jgi:hypothetical protein
LFAQPYTVYATQEGLAGQCCTAPPNNHTIATLDWFVALPSPYILNNQNSWNSRVRVVYNNISIIAPVWDIGPWNVDDDYWNPDQTSFSVFYADKRQIYKDLWL